MISLAGLDSVMSAKRQIDNVESAIYLIRGQRVMLDSDLAAIYQVTTRRLNEQLRRNRALLKSSTEQSRSGAPAAFLFQQKRDEGVASTRFGSFSTEPARVLVA